VQEILQGHPLDLQETSEAYLGNNQCKWTAIDKSKVDISYEGKAYVR